MDSKTDFEIRRLRQQNGLLTIGCIALGLVAYVLYEIADRPRISLYDDYSLQYSPGLWWSNEKTIYVYRSEDMDSLAIGYYDESQERLFDLAWIFHVESEEEAVRHNKPLTSEERDRLYKEMGLVE